MISIPSVFLRQLEWFIEHRHRRWSSGGIECLLWDSWASCGDLHVIC